MRRNRALMWILVIFGLLLTITACNLLPGPMPSLIPKLDVVPGKENVVHILIPCATLTPYQDYRDFMTPGSAFSSAGGTVRGYPAPGYPTSVPGFNETVIPPAEATLVFDRSEGCE